MAEVAYINKKPVMIFAVEDETVLPFGKMFIDDSLVEVKYALIENNTRGTVEAGEGDLSFKIPPRSISEMRGVHTQIRIKPDAISKKTGKVRAFLSVEPIDAIKESLKYSFVTDSDKRGYLGSFILNVNSVW